MNAKILMIIALLILSITNGYTKNQEKDRKLDKAEKRLELQKQIASFIDSKQFVFVANRALPMWGTSIYLTSNSNYLKFDPSYIESYMPFFGDAYSTDYTIDPGVKFEGKPDEFDVKKLNNDKGYDVRAKVSLPRDTYDIFMHVGLDGNAVLTISSYNRSSISYVGSIFGMVQPSSKEKGNVI